MHVKGFFWENTEKKWDQFVILKHTTQLKWQTNHTSPFTFAKFFKNIHTCDVSTLAIAPLQRQETLKLKLNCSFAIAFSPLLLEESSKEVSLSVWQSSGTTHLSPASVWCSSDTVSLTCSVFCLLVAVSVSSDFLLRGNGYSWKTSFLPSHPWRFLQIEIMSCQYFGSSMKRLVMSRSIFPGRKSPFRLSSSVSTLDFPMDWEQLLTETAFKFP